MRPAYLYDGSFEGLLTAVFEAYYRREVPGVVARAKGYQENMLQVPVHIATDRRKADRVSAAVRSKISPATLENSYFAYLSELPGCDMWIYEYLRLGFKLGGSLNRHLTDDRVSRVLEAAGKVTWEKHKMTGLLRFSLIGPDTYFAAIEPQYNIASLLAPHFANRYAGQKWIIYDAGRKLAAVYDTKRWIMESGVELNQYVGAGGTEALYQNLWRLYFRSISIKSRENLRLQRSFMPRRYWKYLPEKQLPPAAFEREANDELRLGPGK